jgi:hypothetical protein
MGSQPIPIHPLDLAELYFSLPSPSIELVRKDEGFTTSYEFGDTKSSRGLKLSKWNCYLVTDGCRGSSAKFRMTFLMTDVGAVQEAIDEGYKAYRKKEF